MNDQDKMDDAFIDHIISNWSPREHAKAYHQTDSTTRTQIAQLTTQKLNIFNVKAPVSTRPGSGQNFQDHAKDGSYSDDGLFLLAASPQLGPLPQQKNNYASVFGVAIDINSKKATRVIVSALVNSESKSGGELEIIGTEVEKISSVEMTTPFSSLKKKLLKLFDEIDCLQHLQLKDKQICLEVKSPAIISRSDSLMLTALIAIYMASSNQQSSIDNWVFSADINLDGSLSTVGNISEKSAYVIKELKQSFLISQLNTPDIPEEITMHYTGQLYTCRTFKDVLVYLGLDTFDHQDILTNESSESLFQSTHPGVSKSPPETGYIEKLQQGVRNICVTPGTGTEYYIIDDVLLLRPDSESMPGQAICYARRFEDSDDQQCEKVVLKITTFKETELNSLIHEASITAGRFHENILKTYMGFTIKKEFFLPMEVAQNKFSDDLSHVPIETKVKWSFNLIDALGKLHNIDYIHGDIKPPNVFIVNNIPKLADFGLSTYGTIDFRHPGLIESDNNNKLLTEINKDDRKQWDNYAMGFTIFRLFCPNYIIEGLNDIPLSNGFTERVGLSENDINTLKKELNKFEDIELRDSLIKKIEKAVSIKKEEPVNLSKFAQLKKDPKQFVQDVLACNILVNTIREHPITCLLISIVCAMSGMYATAFMSDKLYDQLFVNLNYMTFGSIFFIIYLYLRSIYSFGKKINNIVHTSLFIFGVTFFISAYLIQFAYNDYSSASCAARRILRLPLTASCWQSLEERCKNLLNEKNWHDVILLVDGYGLIRGGVQPTEPYYIKFFKPVVTAKTHLLISTKGDDQQIIKRLTQSILDEYERLLICNKVLLNQKKQNLFDNTEHPKEILREAQLWDKVTINSSGQTHIIFGNVLKNRLKKAIQQWD